MIPVPSKITTSLAACGAALLLAILTPAVVSAAPVTVACTPTKVAIVASDFDGSSSSLTTYSNIGEATVTFVQGGAKPSCAIVRFSATTSTGLTDAVVIRAFINNQQIAIPNFVVFSEGDGSFGSAHSYDFLFPILEPGSYTVHMQFKSFFGNNVHVNRHTTTVLHE